MTVFIQTLIPHLPVCIPQETSALQRCGGIRLLFCECKEINVSWADNISQSQQRPYLSITCFIFLNYQSHFSPHIVILLYSTILIASLPRTV